MGGYAGDLALDRPVHGSTPRETDGEAQLAASNKAGAGRARWRDEEKAAKTDEEKIAIAAERKAIESRPKNPMSTMMAVNQVQMGDPTFIGYTWIDVVDRGWS